VGTAWHPAASLLLAVLLVSGCAPLNRLDDRAFRVNRALEQTGIRDIDWEYDQQEDGWVVELRYRSDERDPASLRAETGRVAELVWDRFPLRLDGLVLRPRAPASADPRSTRLTDGQLEAAYGPRPDGVDEARRATSVATSVLGVGLAWLLSLVALAVAALMLLRRLRRPARRTTSTRP